MRKRAFIRAAAISFGCLLLSLPSLAQTTSTNDPDFNERRIEFLQKNFSKFVPVEFKKDADSHAMIQTLHVQDNLFEFEGRYYCGFRFTIPEWRDNGFQWLFLFPKKAPDNPDTHGFDWYIVPELDVPRDLTVFSPNIYPNTQTSKGDSLTTKDSFRNISPGPL